MAYSERSVPNTNIEFPDDSTYFKMQCPRRCTSPKKLNLVKSSDFGTPRMISNTKKFHKSSSYYSISTNIDSIKAFSKNPPHGITRVLNYKKHIKSVKNTPLQLLRPCANSIELNSSISFTGKCPRGEEKEFKLTEDPRKRFRLKNYPRNPISPLEQDKIKELVKAAKNDVSLSESKSSITSICEVIDVSNPLGLDFQGTDYKNTYERDEQSCQNQIEYRQIKRFQHRRNVQLETIHNTEKKQQLERVALPKHFIVGGSVQTNRDLRLSKFLIEKRPLLGTLVRAEQKPDVVQKLKEEDKRRRERYKDLYVKKKLKISKKYDEEIQAKKVAIEEYSTVLANKDIDGFANLLVRNNATKKMNTEIITQQKRYPHNILETQNFKKDMKKSRRVRIEQAKVIQNFYDEKAINKKIPESLMEISADSCSLSTHSYQEQSTNDEDDMVAGKNGSRFFLRGFCYKQGSNLRGKFHQNEVLKKGKKIKGCVTRTEWFESLVSRKNQRKNGKHDSELNLFPREVGLNAFNAKSAIQEFRQNSMACHYNRRIFKKLHIKKPNTLKVRKFNLIGYLYGNATTKKSRSNTDLEINPKDLTMDFIRHKTEKEKLKKTVQKLGRMRYLGVSCPQGQSSKARSSCVDSNSIGSEWVPDEITNGKMVSKHIDLQARGNMPAPSNRETTLRQNPKHSRDYEQLRVPSELFDTFVKNHHIPVMKKPREDKKIFQNIRSVKNTEFAKKFDARHHHDHWNPTQHKSIHVRYSRKIVKPKVLEDKSEVRKKRSKVPLTLDIARPRGYIANEVDFSLPKSNIDEIIEEHGKRPKIFVKEQIDVKEIRQSKDIPIHSRADGECHQFPGRQKFIEFISNIKLVVKKRSDINNTELGTAKNNFIRELQEDLLSIESCLSSLSSSKCTNLSMNSGSFLMIGDKKILLDYFRKSVVPFEEMNRHRIEAIPINDIKKEMNPYQIVPFAGQQKEQLSIPAGKDNFFTFNARLQNGLRQRLELETERETKENSIGAKRGPKAVAQVATDIDKLYIEDLNQLSPLKLFRWNSYRTMFKDALRKKFESMLIQGEIVRTKISDRRNEEYYEQMMKSKDLFEKLFAKWEKQEYETAMEVVNKIKPYYEATDVYRKEYQELNKRFTILNMDIVYIENNWASRTILQNFHYLLAELDWRVEQDWIHRNLDGSLESFQESIAKRCIVNIRHRDKDDAWAVKAYYEEIFLKNPHPVILVFTNAKEFVNGIENLKSKTFVLLKALHYTLRILAELEQRYREFSDWCTFELESKKKFGQKKCANKYYMENRAEKLKDQVKMFLEDPITETFADKQLSFMKGISNEIYMAIVPMTDQMDLSTFEQVAAISELLNKLIGKLEKIPVTQRIRVEKKHRRLLSYHRNMSKQAVVLERRIDSEMVKVQRNLAPAFQKPKRQGKLQRLELKKMKQESHKKSMPITDQTKFFVKAFHDEGDPNDLTEARESLDVIDGIQHSIVPFYFDHFLIVNGYQPSYDFKTQVELMDGPEIDRMQIKKVLPEIMDKFEKWQAMKKRIMEENISKHPHMYQNVRI